MKKYIYGLFNECEKLLSGIYFSSYIGVTSFRLSLHHLTLYFNMVVVDIYHDFQTVKCDCVCNLLYII